MRCGRHPCSPPACRASSGSGRRCAPRSPSPALSPPSSSPSTSWCVWQWGGVLCEFARPGLPSAHIAVGRHVLCGGSKLCRQRSKTAGCTQPIGHSSPHPAPALLQVWGQRSSGAVPFGTLCALVFLWCGVSVPLCFVGSYFGYKKPAPEVRGAVGQGWTLWLQAAACMGLLLRRTSSSPSTGCGMQDPPHSPSVLTNRPAPATPSPTSPPPPPSPHSRTRCAPTRSRARCRSSRGTCTPPSPSLLAASCPLAR